MALLKEPNAETAIAELLGVAKMDRVESIRTKLEIEAFVANGDATAASQLIHAAGTRRRAPRQRPHS